MQLCSLYILHNNFLQQNRKEQWDIKMLSLTNKSNLYNKLSNSLSELVDKRNNTYADNLSDYNRCIKYEFNIKHGKIKGIIFYIADINEDDAERDNRYTDYIREYDLTKNKVSVGFGNQFVKYFPFANTELLKLLSELYKTIHGTHKLSSELYGIIQGTKIKYKQRDTDIVSNNIMKLFCDTPKEKKHYMNIRDDNGNIKYVLFFNNKQIPFYIEYDNVKNEYYMGNTDNIVCIEFGGNIFGSILELIYSLNTPK